MALIMASVTPTASGQGQSVSPLEDRGVQGLRRHAEEPQVANAVVGTDSVIGIISRGKFSFCIKFGDGLDKA